MKKIKQNENHVPSFPNLTKSYRAYMTKMGRRFNKKRGIKYKGFNNPKG